MSVGTLTKQDGIEQETIVATLVDLPRFKLDLVKYEWGGRRHFLLRRMKFMAAENVKGTEIKIEEGPAKMLAEALLAALDAPLLDAPPLPVPELDPMRPIQWVPDEKTETTA